MKHFVVQGGSLWKPHRLEEIGEVCQFLSEKLLSPDEQRIWTIYFMVLDLLKYSAKERRGCSSSRYGYIL